MRIDIWSDVICPWCYLGSRRLAEALDRLALDDIELRWRAYQLDPGAPREPTDLRASLDRKYGPGAFDSMTPRLTALGAQVGIDYRFDKALRVNTADAHRLIAWAATQGAATPGGPQDLLVQTLFRSYFTDGADLCDQRVLVGAASEVGLDPGEAGAVLAAGAFAEEVDVDLAAGAERGISGVPAFVIEDEWVIPGAKEVDQMVRLLSRVGGTEQARR